ncbi:hypothetical protein BB558_006739 [Smittium angustum]|nr:hypothetical protein BB558_007252 [Smittium angustum]PVZ97303.1 hypothetical protein BB558_006739 [Smittium angustum]
MTKLIGTHSGSFHADEALAIFILQLLPQYSDSLIVRTRDPIELEKCDIVVDVGGVYDHQTKRYDHHQRSFNETFSSDFKTKLSSAGLIYKHYGTSAIQTIIPDIEANNLEILYKKVYKSLIEGFDGVDNGISRYPSDIDPLYEENTSISSRVKHLNPSWEDPNPNYDEKFKLAIPLVGDLFMDTVKYYGLSWMPARQIVQDAFDSRYKVDPSGLILSLERFCPWESHLFEIEDSLNDPNMQKPLYVIFEDSNGSCRVRAISKKLGSFENRKPLPEQWRGYRDDELSERSKIKDCIFVHATGFIGGNKTKEGAIEMARKSINM